MPALSAVSDTLYVPLLGRIYASRHYPGILYDRAALALYGKLDLRVKAMPGQTEYASLASAVRSLNMDHDVRAFLSAHPNGTIVNIGCGLETIFQRCDNGSAVCYELDLPEVLTLRSRYIPETERDRYLPYSMFDYAWMDVVRKTGNHPVMVIAAGVFIYFPEETVIDFIRHLSGFQNAEIVFDTVSPSGLKISNYYIRKMGKQEAQTYFSVKDAAAFAVKISPGTRMLEERRFYSLVDYGAGISFSTRFRMAFSDMFSMVKTIHLQLHT